MPLQSRGPQPRRPAVYCPGSPSSSLSVRTPSLRLSAEMRERVEGREQRVMAAGMSGVCLGYEIGEEEACAGF